MKSVVGDAAGKVGVQILKRDGQVCTDSLSSYDVLDISGFHHHRINHKGLY